MKFSILLASAALAGAVFAQADLDRPGAVPRATTSIGFLTPDELATTTRRYRDWKHSLFLRAAAPAGDGCDFAPLAAFPQGTVPYLHYVACNFGTQPDELTELKVEIFDPQAKSHGALTATLGRELGAGGMNNFFFTVAKIGKLAPGQYTLKATLNPERSHSVRPQSQSIYWGFTVLGAAAPAATPSAPAAPRPPSVADTPTPAPAVRGGSAARSSEFVFVDGNDTGMPIMSCRVPAGCVAISSLTTDIRDRYNPTRYFVQVIDPRDGTRLTAASTIVLTQQNVFATPAQCFEMYKPQALAAYIGHYLFDMYQLQNPQVVAATAAPWNDDFAAGIQRELQQLTQQRGLPMTQFGTMKISCRYRGTVGGRPKIVGAEFLYYYSDIGNRYRNGCALQVMTFCADAASADAAARRLADFAPTVTYNQVFAEYLDRLASQTIDTITGGLARMGQAFLQIGRELENAYASGRRASMYNSERRSAAVARFSDAIRGEEAVRNPQTGATAYISTGSDHCAITASGQQLYWNGDYNPNTDPNLNNVNWSVMR